MFYLGWTNVIKNHTSHRRFLLSCPHECEWPLVKLIGQLSGATAECCEYKKFTEEFTLCEMGSHVTLGRQFLKSNKCLVDFGRAKLLLQGKELDFVDHDGLKIEQNIILCNIGVTENNRKSLNYSKFSKC